MLVGDFSINGFIDVWPPREPLHSVEADALSLPRERLVGLKTMLRPGVEQEICATCHGADAPKLYLYFHNPAKRKAVAIP